MDRAEEPVRMQSWPLRRAVPGLKEVFRRQKCLRFADVEGLPLVSVKVFQESEGVDDRMFGWRWPDGQYPPQCRSNFDDFVSLFKIGEKSTSPSRAVSQGMPCKDLVFEQSLERASDDLLGVVERQQVCLESVAVNGFTVVGTIRVQNLAFDKTVSVRHTTNDWQSHTDLPAVYIPGSSDGRTDRFSFTLVIADSLSVNSRLQFAINFKSGGGDFWDSNGGSNYSLLCRLAPVKTETTSVQGNFFAARRPQRRMKGQFLVYN